MIDSCCCVPFFNDYVIESVIMKNGSDDRNGEAIMMLSRGNERYEMNIELKEGKKEGVCKIMREDGTLFMKVMFVNDMCEGELIKKNEYGKTVLKGRLERGIEVGLWIEYDDRGKEIWRGLYRNGKRYSTLKKTEGMDGFNSEVSDKGELLNVGEYDKDWIRNGRSFECEGGHVKRECIYEDGVRTKVIREFTDKGLMRVFDDKGRIVYEGVWFGDIVNGFSAYPRMEGMDGFFKEMNEKGELLSVSGFDGEWKRDGVCYEYKSGKVLNELKRVKIGKDSFYLSKDTRKGSKCLIMNCDGLREVEIGDWSFEYYEVFELKNLPSLHSIQMGRGAFAWCQSIVFESDNDE